MKSGDITEFIDQLYLGSELVFIYNDKKYFIQGWTEDNKAKMVLDAVSYEKFDKYIWQHQAKTIKECADAFLSAPIWQNKNFTEIQDNVIWADW